MDPRCVIGGARDPNNYRKRVLGKLLEKLNLPKLTFQVIRRTMATLSQTKGTVKDTGACCVTPDFQRQWMFTYARGALSASGRL